MIPYFPSPLACINEKLELPIDLDYGTVWTHVGYIASELCKYLHPLIAAGDVVDVYVQCIKYRVDFFN